MDDIIVTPDGRHVGRLDPVFKGIPERVINEAQIAQIARDRVVMRYVPGEAFDIGALDTIQAELESRLGPLVRVEMKRVGHIPRTSSGKFRAVVSELKSRA
jgi:phenylacetate-CoA ligase